ncbi:MAG: Nramp family divalent metal transporter [Opitutaceae bacterium]
MPTPLRHRFRLLGPGLVLAAAGIGAADVVVASVTGIKFGTTLLWAVVFTVALKFALTEALARWQLATGETVVHAWATRLPRAIGVGFGIYLLFWTFMVGAALSSACGLAVTSFFPGVPLQVGGAIHAVAGGGARGAEPVCAVSTRDEGAHRHDGALRARLRCAGGAVAG